MMYLGDKAVGINSQNSMRPSYSLNLVYGQGLSRIYDSYSSFSNRARSEDIQLKTNEGLIIKINDSNYQVAVGAWIAESHNNILYGSWDNDLAYFPSQNALIKIVIRHKSDRDLILNEIPENAITIDVVNYIKLQNFHT